MALPTECETQKSALTIELPIPAQATLISNSKGILVYQTDATMKQVVAFQEEQLPEYGWSHSTPQIIEAHKTIHSFTQADHTIHLTVNTIERATVKSTLTIQGSDSSSCALLESSSG